MPMCTGSDSKSFATFLMCVENSVWVKRHKKDLSKDACLFIQCARTLHSCQCVTTLANVRGLLQVCLDTVCCCTVRTLAHVHIHLLVWKHICQCGRTLASVWKDWKDTCQCVMRTQSAFVNIDGFDPENSRSYTAHLTLVMTEWADRETALFGNLTSACKAVMWIHWIHRCS